MSQQFTTGYFYYLLFLILIKMQDTCAGHFYDILFKFLNTSIYLALRHWRPALSLGVWTISEVHTCLCFAGNLWATGRCTFRRSGARTTGRTFTPQCTGVGPPTLPAQYLAGTSTSELVSQLIRKHVHHITLLGQCFPKKVFCLRNIKVF